MKTRNPKYNSLIYIMCDAFFMLMTFTIAYILRVKLNPKPVSSPINPVDYIGAFVQIIPIWIILFASIGLYKTEVYHRRLVEWSKIFIGSMVGILLIIGWEFFTDTHIFPARLVAIYIFFGLLLSLIVEREIIRFIRGKLYRYGYGVSKVLVIGNSSATRDIIESLSDTKESGYQIVAYAGPANVMPAHLGIHRFGRVEDALKNIKDLNITTVIQTDLYDSKDRNQKILNAAQVNHIQYNFIPGESEFYTGKNTVDVFLGYPMITVSQTPLTGWGAIIKRIFDLVVVIITLSLWGSLLIVISILQKIFNPGPIFYISKRYSQFSKPINLWKFRSMGAKYGKKEASLEFEEMGRPDLAEEYRINHKVENDPRITKFGKFLRNTSLDELPQFINVITGDLSLVGPRPILPHELKFNPVRTALLHSVKSGITGLWQVSGRSELSFSERIELELYYARNWSFWLDIRILLKTITVVIRKKGAK